VTDQVTILFSRLRTRLFLSHLATTTGVILTMLFKPMRKNFALGRCGQSIGRLQSPAMLADDYIARLLEARPQLRAHVPHSILQRLL
jgi:hypothetical protein